MTELTFKYSTVYTFDSPVADHFYKIKCCPMTMARQTVEDFSFRVTGGNYSCRGRDSFGNGLLYGRIEKPHDVFIYKMEGKALVHSDVPDRDGRLAGLFCRQSEYTMPGDKITAAVRQIADKTGWESAASMCCLTDAAGRKLSDTQTAGNDTGIAPCGTDSDMQFCIFVNSYVHNLITYKQWHTDVTTTAEEAAKLATGVCQDYSHIMISILRMFGIPARYVVGMMTGEGYSHAWVEAFVRGTDGICGWYGFDPTNDAAAGDSYIKLSHGRDYADCMLMRGIFKGSASQTQDIQVVVAEKC